VTTNSAVKKYFTVGEANRLLPLVRVIVRDIVELAQDLRERHERLTRLRPSERGALGEAYKDELHQVQEEFERDQDRMRGFEEELRNLGVELKDYHTGLIDFPCWKDNREVYLCWKHGESEVLYWHELDAGFSGRQKLKSER
jgi:hypothetical protein